MPGTAHHLRFVAVADHALLVELGTVIDDAVTDRVHALDRALAADPPKGLRETVPAFVNLLVDFDPLLTDHPSVEAAVRARLPAAGAAAAAPRARRVVEVCYDADLAPDLPEVAARTGLAPEAVIAAHLSGRYRVGMFGFAPGYAYMSGTPDAIQLPRKTAPVRGVPAGQVIIAGPQCIVTTLEMPAGWWRIGRSPTRILRDDPDRPFLFDAGDLVEMRRIDRAAYDRAMAADHG